MLIVTRSDIDGARERGQKLGPRRNEIRFLSRRADRLVELDRLADRALCLLKR